MFRWLRESWGGWVGLGWVEDEGGSEREVESFEMDEMRRREVRRGVRTHESGDKKTRTKKHRMHDSIEREVCVCVCVSQVSFLCAG